MTQPLLTVSVGNAATLYGASTDGTIKHGPVAVTLASLGVTSRVFGVAIADRSELRGVRICSYAMAGKAPSSWSDPVFLELVEGAPLAIPMPASDTIYLDRLDVHDGNLVLAFALTPEAVPMLPRSVSPVSRLTLSALAVTAVTFAYVRLGLPRLRAGGRSLSLRIYNPGASAGAWALYGCVGGADPTVDLVGIAGTAVSSGGLPAATYSSTSGVALLTATSVAVRLAGGAGIGPLTGAIEWY